MNAREFYARLEKVVALTYDDRLPAPYVSAKGSGATARRIRELAESSDIPVVENRAVAEPVFDLELYDFIPEELYRSVAALYMFVYGLETRSRDES